jgi:NAD-reducing hydrogenase large subunit
MSRTVTIDPVSRIEGHARITLTIGDQGEVADARLHLTQFCGFETYCEGRPYRELPALAARIHGNCPVSHALAATKACDQLLAVRIPPTAETLRRVINLAQILESHALAFFYLSAPDLHQGWGGDWDSDPSSRNIFAIMREDHALVREGMRLRQIGQTIIEALGGKKVDPLWAVPGGVIEPLGPDQWQTILAMLPEGLAIARRTYADFKALLPRFEGEASHFGTEDTLFLSLVSPAGHLEHYDGFLRIKDARGWVLEDQVPVGEYHRLLGEAVEDFSYGKFPYYRPRGYPDGAYRVGPLARLNNATACGTPYADVALAEFHMLAESGPVASGFHNHYARLVEIIYALEMIERLLKGSEVLDTRVRARARSNRDQGVGIVEAPRGTLIHHYRIDDHGLVTWANLIRPNDHNNLAMNRAVREAAAAYVDGNRLQQGMLNRVEAAVRCYA